MIDIPDELFRRAEASAARRGVSFPELVTETLREKLGGPVGETGAASPPWMHTFGALSHLREETRRIEALIEEEFEHVEEGA